MSGLEKSSYRDTQAGLVSWLAILSLGKSFVRMRGAAAVVKDLRGGVCRTEVLGSEDNGESRGSCT